MAHLVNVVRQSLFASRKLLPAFLRKPVGRWLRQTQNREIELAGFRNFNTGEVYPGFAITRHDTHLDVGCGPGGTSGFGAEIGAEVISVDIDPEMIDIVHRKLSKLLPAGRFETHVSDSNPLPLPSARATRITAEEVMEHVDDPEAFLSELYRVGKPGALYLITVPDAASEKVLKPFTPPLIWEKPYHIHIFERPEFARLVRQSGLQIVSHEFGGFYNAMWWFLAWCGNIQGDIRFGSSQTKALKHWNRTWMELVKSPEGRKAREALDQVIPKSQRIIARKPG